MSTLYYESSIAHHGVRGQKWGVRRYQNPDGSLTLKGRRKLLGESKKTQKLTAKVNDLNEQAADAKKAGLNMESERIRTKAYKIEKGALRDSKSRDEFINKSKSIGESRSTGEKLVTNLLAGPFANRTVNVMLASGATKAEAIGSSIVVGMLTGPVGHVIASSIYATDVTAKKQAGISPWVKSSREKLHNDWEQSRKN